jgi:hypothetical protein
MKREGVTTLAALRDIPTMMKRRVNDSGNGEKDINDNLERTLDWNIYPL